MARFPKTVYWTIQKGQQNVSVSPSALNVAEGETGTASVSRLGSGTVSASAVNAAVASSGASGTTVSVRGVSAGSTVVNVNVAESDYYESGSAAVSASVKAAAVSVAVPTVSAAVPYTGYAQSPTWNGYDSTKMRIGGTTSAVDVGTYTATFTLLGNCVWADGTTAAKSVSWSIGKASQNIRLSATSVSVEEGGTATVTVTRSGSGTISATSATPNYATVSASGYTLTIRGVSAGSASVTVRVAATDSYEAAETRIAVNVSAASGGSGAVCKISVASDVSGIEVYYSNGESDSSYNTVLASRGSTRSLTVPLYGMVVIRSTSNDAGTLSLVAGTGSCSLVADLKEYSTAKYGYPMRAYIIRRGGTFTWQRQ